MELNKAIEELCDTYRSIDIRVFAMLESTWNSIYTVIRFRREYDDVLEKTHQELIRKCGGLIETPEFRIGVFHFPIQKWDKIYSDLQNKFLCLKDDFAINFTGSINLNNDVSEPHSNSSIDYVFKNWNMYSGKIQTSQTRPNYVDKLSETAIATDFGHINEYLSAIFEMNHYEFQNQPSVMIYAPVFFKIEKILFTGNKAEIDYSLYPQDNLKMVLNFFSAKDHQHKPEFLGRKPVALKNNGNGDDLVKDQQSLTIEPELLGNEFQILVTKNKKLILHNDRSNIGEHFPTRSEFTNPIFAIFEKFVSRENLEKMLFEFESEKGDLKDEAKVFERAITWLFNLLGFHAIQLGNYEKMDRYDNVTIDVLAELDTNEIFLVNVTKSLPKPSDLDLEKSRREKIQKTLQNPELKIKSIYITGETSTEFENTARQNQIILIDKPRLKLILDHLKNGDVENARSIITNQSTYGATF